MRSLINQVVILLFCLVTLSSCKSQFEKIRESGNPEEVFQKANEYYDNGDYLKANTLFELVLTHYRSKKEGEQLYYRYADTQFKLNRFLTSAFYFERFAATYANSDRREEADFMVAHSYYQLSPSFRLEQQYSEKAIEAYQKFVNFHPQSPRVAESNELIDKLRRKLEKKAFDSAELYYKMENYKAALHSFENLLKDYPETPEAENIRYLITKAAYNLAVDSYYEKKKSRFMQATEYYNQFIKRYPQSKYKKELELINSKSLIELNNLADV